MGGQRHGRIAADGWRIASPHGMGMLAHSAHGRVCDLDPIHEEVGHVSVDTSHV